MLVENVVMRSERDAVIENGFLLHNEEEKKRTRERSERARCELEGHVGAHVYTTKC